MPIVDDFIKAEEQKMTWFDRLVQNYPKVETTKLIARSTKSGKYKEATVIRPSLTDKTIAAVIILFLSLFWLGFLKLLLGNTTLFFSFFLPLLFITFIICIVIYNSFFNKKYIYTLILNKDSISVDHRPIKWSEIVETCIMNVQEGRTTNFYLILFKKDKTMEKLNLYKFGISDVKLSAMIEYYKNAVV
jgi:hypothetical protein